MAIEMIEYSDLPAAAPDTGGFVERYSTKNTDLAEKTEGQYANFSISDLSLIGRIIGESKDKKKLEKAQSNNAIKAAVNKEFPVPGDNCQALLDAKTRIDNELYKVNQQILAGDSAKTKTDYVNALTERLTLIKNKIDALKCIELLENAELEKNKQETIEALAQAKMGGIPESTNDKINKFIVWGISGMMVLAAIIILLKKKKAEA